mmetsp:Transcript_6177/g.7791  ORF Transcript_6177/g.7791 Transcript_6177/m.7791 type:complete len:148 (-) Transcript_6177:83-526(-)
MEGKVREEKVSNSEVEDVITVEKVRFHGNSNLCPVSAKLDFTVKYATLRPLKKAKWQVKYLLDTITKKQTINLGRTPEEDLDGESSFRFQISSIDVSNVKPSQLCNVGLLICTLLDEFDNELADIKMVAQVSKEGDQLKRCIYNPLG